MGCDIHTYVEVKENGEWKFNDLNIWDFCNYGVFGFLADVRNYSAINPIKKPAYKIPEDSSDWVRERFSWWDQDAHTASSLTLQELLAVDYEKEVWNRRVTRQIAPNYWEGGMYNRGPKRRRKTYVKRLPWRVFYERLGEVKAVRFP